MTSIAELASILQRLNDPRLEALARATGFVKRARHMSGRAFVTTLVLGWLHDPDSSLSSLSARSYEAGAGVSRQGLAQRFTESAAAFLEQVLYELLGQWVTSSAPVAGLLAKFTEVWVVDSTVVRLLAALAERWAGCGGHTGESAALKVNVGWDVKGGGLRQVALSAGRQHDQRSAVAEALPPPGSVWLADNGYWALYRLARLSRAGVAWVTHLKADARLYDDQQQPVDWLAWLEANPTGYRERTLRLGSGGLPCRLCAVRLNAEATAYHRAYLERQCAKHGRTPSPRQYQLCAWLVVVTNLSATQASLEEVLVLARLRWQIEKLFDIWKTDGGLDRSRSQQPWRQLCEVYAKLIALLIQHWCSLLGVWHLPARSLRQAYRVVRDHASLFAFAWRFPRHWAAVLTFLTDAMRACRMTACRGRPHTYQLLEQPSLVHALT